jgi:hypothetical protein
MFSITFALGVFTVQRIIAVVCNIRHDSKQNYPTVSLTVALEGV